MWQAFSKRANNRLSSDINGFKPKRVKTRIGELNLSIPQTRSSDFYQLASLPRHAWHNSFSSSFNATMGIANHKFNAV
jgi:hypothetical protein